MGVLHKGFFVKGLDMHLALHAQEKHAPASPENDFKKRSRNLGVALQHLQIIHNHFDTMKQICCGGGSIVI
jgi:hypothetical protein